MSVHKAEYVPRFTSFCLYFGHKWAYSSQLGRQGVPLKIFSTKTNIIEDIQIKFRKSKKFFGHKFWEWAEESLLITYAPLYYETHSIEEKSSSEHKFQI